MHIVVETEVPRFYTKKTQNSLFSTHESDTYSGITMVGAFGKNHIQDDCFEELSRILKPGEHNTSSYTYIDEPLLLVGGLVL